MFQSLVKPPILFGALMLFIAPAWTQTSLGAHTLDLVFPTQDLKFATLDLKFSVETVAGGIQGTVAKTQELQVKETKTEIRIELAADVLFDFDKAIVRPEAASALHNVAEIIKDRGKGRNLRVDGYTDSKGGDAYNQKLSDRRANAVKLWLTQKEGLPQAKITSRGFGAMNPIAPNVKSDGSDDPIGRQKNRRVEIVLSK